MLENIVVLQSKGIFDSVGPIASSVFSVTVIAIVALIFLAVFLGVMYYFFMYKKKFNIMVKIISERSNEDNVIFDKAAILFDRKTNSKYFKLLSSKVELESPPFKILQQTNKGDYLELYRKSEDEFVFLVQPRIDKEYIIRADGKKYPLAKIKHHQMEADQYWLMKRKTEDKGWISPEGFGVRLLQMLPIIVPSAFMLIILFIFIDKLPEILGQLSTLIDKLGIIEGVKTKVG